MAKKIKVDTFITTVLLCHEPFSGKWAYFATTRLEGDLFGEHTKDWPMRWDFTSETAAKKGAIQFAKEHNLKLSWK